jgi:hypothetical protein
MARNGKTIGLVAAVALISMVCVPSAPARASSEFSSIDDAYGGLTAVGWTIFMIVDGAVCGSGLLNSVGNTYYAAQGERPPDSWIAGGLVSGLLNIVVGVATLALHEDSPVLSDRMNNAILGIGIGNIVVGALDIGSSIWAGQMPNKTSKSVQVAPLIMRDVEGNPAVGIGLNLVDW